MPKLVRWFVKTALVYFILSLLLGVYQTLTSASGSGSLPAIFPVYLHLLVVGWITQLIIGVAVWMFPKFTQQQPRGRESLLWACYGLLNLGLVLRALTEPLVALYPGALWGWVLALSALVQGLAGALFVGAAWPRVKEK